MRRSRAPVRSSTARAAGESFGDELVPTPVATVGRAVGCGSRPQQLATACAARSRGTVRPSAWSGRAAPAAGVPRCSAQPPGCLTGSRPPPSLSSRPGVPNTSAGWRPVREIPHRSAARQSRGPAWGNVSHRFDGPAGHRLGLESCPANGRRVGSGERSFLENSTACRKSVPYVWRSGVRSLFGGRVVGVSDHLG